MTATRFKTVCHKKHLLNADFRSLARSIGARKLDS